VNCNLSQYTQAAELKQNDLFSENASVFKNKKGDEFIVTAAYWK